MWISLIRYLINSFELVQESKIIFKELPEVFDLVFQHGDAFDPHAQGKARIDLTVNVAILKDRGIHHAAAKYLNPACVLADIASFAAAYIAGDIHFSGWFSKWEIGGAQPDLCLLAKHLLCKEKQRLFQVGKRYPFVNIKRFHLVEDTMRTG